MLKRISRRALPYLWIRKKGGKRLRRQTRRFHKRAASKTRLVSLCGLQGQPASGTGHPRTKKKQIPSDTVGTFGRSARDDKKTPQQIQKTDLKSGTKKKKKKNHPRG